VIQLQQYFLFNFVHFSSTMTEELPSSELGTKEYWDKAYTTENENFDKDGLEGEVWFGEESTDRIMRWLQRNNDLIPTTYSILDLGCGNGQAAFAFRDEGYNDITGVDYSESAIELSNKIAKKCNAESIIFKKCDILSNISEIQQVLGRNSFDVCFDKGTYDAISLCPEEAKLKRQKYIENISELLKSSNSKKYLILTSCNWTKEELVEQLKEKFDVRAVIPTPQFKFGGVVGNNVTSVIFERKL